jgi:N-sulfoglucosamine sulfohydrolase
VRAPEKWRHLLPGSPGDACDQAVSFVDFGPSVLALAGLPTPASMQGHAFLGPEEARAGASGYAHCFRGRMDEVYDCGRSVRDRRYNYIRNYQPHRPSGRHHDYLWKLDSMRAWEREWKAGRLNDIQSAFFRPRPGEELYDLETDPDETVNLAADPAHAETLLRMRAENLRHLRAIGDLGLMPEAEMVRRARGRSPREIFADGYDLDATIAAAELCGRGEGGMEKMIAGLKHPESAVRYWSAAGLATLAPDARPPAGPSLAESLVDESPSVRIAAAEALYDFDPVTARSTLAGLLSHDDLFVALTAADTLNACGITMTEAERKRRDQVVAELTRKTGLNAMR